MESRVSCVRDLLRRKQPRYRNVTCIRQGYLRKRKTKNTDTRMKKLGECLQETPYVFRVRSQQSLTDSHCTRVADKTWHCNSQVLITLDSCPRMYLKLGMLLARGLYLSVIYEQFTLHTRFSAVTCTRTASICSLEQQVPESALRTNRTWEGGTNFFFLSSTMWFFVARRPLVRDTG